METKTKIFIGLGFLTVASIGTYLYIRKVKNTPNKLTINIDKVDWINKSVTYTILSNGKFSQSGTVNFREDLIGKEGGGTFSLKETIREIFEKDKTIIDGSSLGVPQFKATIDFAKKEVTIK